VRGLRAELVDAIGLRAFLLVFGVLLLQLGFILSYVGAFHHPRPHGARIAVAAPHEAAAAVAGRLSALPARPRRRAPPRRAGRFARTGSRPRFS
jgi:hypothetical protein